MFSTLANQELMRQLNAKLVLRCVRDTREISQVDISEQTGLSVATVCTIVNQLKATGLIVEGAAPIGGAGKPKLGRKPVRLRLNPTHHFVIAGSFLPDDTRIALLDLDGQVWVETAYATEPDRGAVAMIDRFCEGARELLASQKLSTSDLLGVGVCSAGVVDHLTGTVLLAYGLKWRNQPVKSLIEAALGVPTSVEGYVTAVAMAEGQWGATRQSSNVCVMEVDHHGIAATVVAGGAILRGQNRLAGEIGWSIVPRRPKPRGKSGEPEELHSLASGHAMVETVCRELRSSGKKRRKRSSIPLATMQAAIRTMQYGPALEAIFSAARQGDTLANEVLDDAAYCLSIALGHLIAASNPEIVLLTGRVIDISRGLMIDRVRASLPQTLRMPELRATRVEAGIVGDHAALKGAATFVYDRLFRATFPIHASSEPVTEANSNRVGAG